MKKHLLSALLSLAGVTGLSHAQTPDSPPASIDLSAPIAVADEPFTIDNPPQTVMSLVHSKDEIKSVFQTGISGVQGWVLVNPAKPLDSLIYYTFGDGLHAFTGTLIHLGPDNKLMSLTENHMQVHAYKPDLSDFWAPLEKSHWVADGAQDADATQVIYGFFDANCVYCHLSWVALEPYMKAGLQVRWIPVAILHESSAPKAAALLTADDPRAVMRAGHEGWDEKRSGAFDMAHVSEKVSQQLDENSELMKKIGLTGTPAFIYKDATGKVSIKNGMPGLARIPEMALMPYIENNNKKLDSFR